MTVRQSTLAPMMSSALERASPASMGIDEQRLTVLYERIEKQIEEGWYPGAAVAMGRHGKLVAARAFGRARLAADGQAAQSADEQTLWLLFSQTKPIVSCAIWVLVERGSLRFHDTIATYLPDFARHGKDKLTLFELLTHQGGFPDASMPPGAWTNHALLRETVCNYTLDWPPGSRVMYHSTAAHWVQAALIEAVTGQDYREFIREQILAPLGLHGLYVGVPDEQHARIAYIYARDDDGTHDLNPERNVAAFWRAGAPGGGGYATAADMVAFYQMLLGLGSLNGVRILSPRMVQYVTRNHTGERIDERFGYPLHRGLGVAVRGHTPSSRGLGTIASPHTFGHGGAGTSYSWADPETGVSFCYLTNSQVGEPWHSRRLDQVSTMAHAAVVEL